MGQITTVRTSIHFAEIIHQWRDNDVQVDWTKVEERQFAKRFYFSWILEEPLPILVLAKGTKGTR